MYPSPFVERISFQPDLLKKNIFMVIDFYDIDIVVHIC